MNRRTLPTFTLVTLVTLVTVLAGAAGCDEGGEPETAADMLADEAVDPELLAELDIEIAEPEFEAAELEAAELDVEAPEHDVDAPVCLVFVPSADEREANPEAELETRCYESRAAMEGTSGWLDNPHAEQQVDSTMYYLGEGFEHINEGGASYVFVSSTRCGAGPSSLRIPSMPAGWNDRLSSYVYRPWSYAGFLADSTCNGVGFYEHSNYGGLYNGAAFGHGIWDVCVVGGMVYGHYVGLTSSTWGIPDLNDKVSSMMWVHASCSNDTWDLYTGNLSGTGDYENEPNTYYYAAASARHKASSTGPNGADFDLRLWWWNGAAWTVVASSLGGTSNESIDYAIGPAGYYWWSMQSYSGSGDYELSVLRIP